MGRDVVTKWFFFVGVVWGLMLLSGEVRCPYTITLEAACTDP